MISKATILQKLFRQKTRDYTYAIIFFLIFSFFIVFLIKPTLNTAFTLRKKLEDLKRIDTAYEKEIVKIVNIQKQLESVRNELYLLTDAMPNSARVNKLINDIKLAADKNKLQLDQVNIGAVSLKESANKESVQPITLNMDINGEFKDLLNFIDDINDQRRIKIIKTFSASRENAESSGSGTLNIKFELEGYYL